MGLNNLELIKFSHTHYKWRKCIFYSLLNTGLIKKKKSPHSRFQFHMKKGMNMTPRPTMKSESIKINVKIILFLLKLEYNAIT